MSSQQFRAALEAGDYMGMWRIMAGAFPTTPQPKTPADAEIILHRIRTEATSMPLKARAYSHAWLTERGLPSALPDNLKPAAERLYPRIVGTVGIAVKMPLFLKAVGAEVQKAMADAVEDLHANGDDLNDRPLVHRQMFGARERTLKQLIGRVSTKGVS